MSTFRPVLVMKTLYPDAPGSYRVNRSLIDLSSDGPPPPVDSSGGVAPKPNTVKYRRHPVLGK